MWNTSCGEKVLAGAERELLCAVIDGMVDSIDMSRDRGASHSVGVSLFDNLLPTQQLATLYCVANALLRDDVPEPEITAVNEATVYALYRELFVWIESEIDFESTADEHPFSVAGDSPYRVRSRVLAAFERSMTTEEIRELEADGQIPDLNCSDTSQWDRVIEVLADRILWDRDFEMEYLLADLEPDKSELLKAYLGIDGDYYSTVSADLSEADFDKLKVEIRKLVRD